jgi:hypothetical protein
MVFGNMASKKKVSRLQKSHACPHFKCNFYKNFNEIKEVKVERGIIDEVSCY